MANEKRQVSIFINGKEVENSIKAIANEKRKLTNEVAKLTRGTEDYENKVKELSKLNGIIREHEQNLRGVESAWNKNTPAVQSFIAASAKLFAVDRIITYSAELGRMAVKAAADAEQVNIAFTTMLGSKEKADQLQAQLFELASKTPFELPQVQQATKQLLAYGFSAQEVIPNLTALGNISAGVGQDKLPQLILAFGQVRSATKLMGTELRQFTEAGVPLLEALSTSMNKPVAVIQKMVSAGQIGFKDVQKALFSLTEEGGRFNNLMQKQSQSLSGLYSTFKDNFTQNVLLPIGQGLSNFIKPALESTNGVFEKLTLNTHALSKGVINTQTAFNMELDTLKKGNLTKDAKKELLQKINTEYGKYLPYLLTEKSSIDEINKAQIIGNAALDKKISMMAAEESLVAARKKLFDAKRQELDLAREVAITEESILNTNEAQTEADMMRDAAQKSVLNERQAKLQENLNTQKQAKEEYDKLLETAKKLGVTFDSVTKSSGTVIADPEEAKKRAEKIADALAKFNDKIRDFNNDVEQANVSAFDKQILRIKEKYQKEIDEVEKFKKEFPEKIKTANNLEVQFRQLAQKEVLATYQKHLSDLEQEAKKFDDDAANRLKSKEELEIESIKQKYAKIIESTLTLENDTKNATQEQRNKAHDLRKKLETEQELEIINLKSKLRAEQEAKDAAETEKFWNDMKTLNEGFRQLMDEQVVKLPSFTDDLDASIQNIEDQANAERAALNKKFDDQIALEGDAKDRILALNKKRGELLEDIALKTNSKIEKSEKDSLNKRQQAYEQLGKAVGDGIVALGDLIAGENVKNSAIQKTAALIKIAIDTATAISSVVTAAASTSLDPITLATKIAAGVTTVLLNIATAKKTLDAAPTISQKAEGGYHDVIGAQDGKRYRAKAAPDFGGGFVNEPTLVGEDIEYTIPNRLLRNPLVANFVPIIESIRTNRGIQQRAEGGYNNESTAPATTTIVTESPTTAKMVSVLENIYEALMTGKIVAVVTSEGAIEVQRSLDKLKKIRGY